jgi:DNA polymerase III subunit gamma/tau
LFGPGSLDRGSHAGRRLVLVPDEPPVPYQALYRRFRPQRFSDVVGQEHVTRALRAAVRDGKVAHAYLFSGPRGTGKTSTARILAMGLNCEHPEDGEPDGTCASCVAIRQGSSMDVQELDSATNRGIDEMRDLLSRVALGTPGRWKVYIIDEVHQMTSAASSALLKTLEEPPGHVVFVLATTDPQKVLPTIRSRTQHFEFRLLGPDVLTTLLEEVNDRAALGLPHEAIDMVVRRGHGSARDALSALDQVAAAGGAEDEAAVVVDLVDAIADQDPGRALVQVADASKAGVDPRRLGTDLLEYLRNGFLATRARSLVMLPDDAAAEAEAQARRMGPATLVRAMETVGQALIDMREAADPRTTLEVALVRLADPEVDDGNAALLARIERLEQAMGARSGTIAASGPIRTPAAGLEQTPQARTPGTVPIEAGRSVGPPPPMPAAASAATPPTAKPALGAHRRSSSIAPEVPDGPSRPEPSEAPAGPAGAGRSASGAVPPPPRATPAPQATSGSALAHQTGSKEALPSRDELTLAWGDRILPALRPAVKVYVASGRFTSVGDTAVYAVPDRGLLARAQAGRAEVEAALTAHFGRPIPFELVLDEGSPNGPATGGPAPSEADREDPADYHLADLEDAPAGVTSPEQRLMKAFPGAEEV